MPIRFRCHHCHQLLGIARRKSGTHVNCPTCHREVLVPAENEAPAVAAPQPVPSPVPAPVPAPAPALFERDDFDALLRPPQSMAMDPPRHSNGGVHAPIIRPSPEYSGQGSSWQRADAAAVGLVLSPARATVLTVVVILLLAIAFGAGLLVGRFYL
jgi:hypothetical protein